MAQGPHDPRPGASTVTSPQPGVLPPRWGEAAFLAAWLIFMLVTVSIRQGHEEFPGPTLLVFTVAAWLPLTLRARWPLGVLVVVVVVESLHLALVPFFVPDLETPIAMGAYQPVPIATMAAVYTVVSRSPRFVGWVAGVGAATVLFVVSLFARPHDLIATDLVMFNLVLIATGIGATVAARRVRKDYEQRTRQDETRREVTAERLRIARELHDVLAHNLTLVNAQAAVADYLLRTDPDAAAVALQDITRHTRSALDELRATVGLLRQDGEPAAQGAILDDGTRAPVPGTSRLPDLVESFRSAGTDVTVTTDGDPRPLSSAADLGVYRIVQEALTNAVKHAPDAPVRIALAWSDEILRVRVANAASTTAPPGHRGPGTGHGLIGMRERALSAGGTFDTARPSGGGFVVSASLPIVRDDTSTTLDTTDTPGATT